MNHRTGMKILLYFCISLIIFFTANTVSFASDYQYKILDPKYNPQAEEIMKGNIPPIEEVKLPEENKGFDFKLLFSIFVLVTFPIVIVTLAAKSYKKIFDEVPGREPIEEKQVIGNIKIPEKDKQIEKQEQKEIKKISETKINNIQKTVYKAELKSSKPRITPEKKIPQTTGKSINKYFSSPIEKVKNPMLLNTSVLSSNKGICLVEYNKKYSLIGYINNEIFMLNQFNAINGTEIRARLSETLAGKDRYIVRLGDFKALVEVSDKNMKMLLEL